MPKSTMGHVAIYTLVDAATGFIITNPRFDKTSTGVAHTILEKYIPYFGCLKVLVTDKGKENVNSEISLLCEKFNIKHVTSSTAHPQSNGLVERRQQMILNYLWKITASADTQGNWPNLLHEFQLITNSTLSHTRGLSPFFLTFFRTPNFPFNKILSDCHLHQSTYVSDKINNAKCVLQTACDNYNAAFQENNTPHAPMIKTIKEGSIVYVRHSQRGKLHIKLAQPFKGPYMCIEIPHNNNIVLTHLAGGIVIHTHINNCKVVPLRPNHLILNPLPASSLLLKLKIQQTISAILNTRPNRLTVLTKITLPLLLIPTRLSPPHQLMIDLIALHPLLLLLLQVTSPRPPCSANSFIKRCSS